MCKNTMETLTEELYSQTFADGEVNIDTPEKDLQIADGTPSERQFLDRRMQKVPPVLRQNKNYQQEYDPLVVSLGPYHHGKVEFQSTESFKRMALQTFVEGSGWEARHFYCQVLQHVDYARNCYIEGSTEKYDDAAFAEMMLLDACFIINLILLSHSSPKNNYITRQHLGGFVIAFAYRDMYILENQIPFRILKLLMCLRYGQQQGHMMLHQFLSLAASGRFKGSDMASRWEKDLPLHFVEAFWQLLVIEWCNSKDKPATQHGPQPISSNGSRSGCLKHMGNSVKCSLLCRHISNLPCFPWRKGKDNGEGAEKYIHCFRSATDLKAKGIHFGPTTTDSLKDVKFKSGYFYALLEVPTWIVTVQTKIFFSNLIAYEMCPSAISTPIVKQYIEFMRLLIDNPKDVKELREKKILFTNLGSDEEVVKVYKEIYTTGFGSVGIFQSVKEEIEAHYNNKAKTWLAELIYIYFRSPWTALALFAATFLLVLTFLQTYYTVRPS